MEIVIKNREKWLICGGRDFENREMFDAAMGDLMRHFGCPSCIIHGAANGADTMAGELGKRLAISVETFPANWGAYGKAAGPVRNSQMLAQKPHKIIAFPGGRGTANMIKQARKAGVDVVEIRDIATP